MGKLNFDKTWAKFKQIPGDKGRCFILGSAPSLEDEPLELLTGQRVFLCNKAWLALKLLSLDKANWLVYTGLGSWENDLAELKEFDPNCERFYSNLITDSNAFKTSQEDFTEDYYVFPKVRSKSLGKGEKNVGQGYLPDQYRDGWGAAYSVVLDAMIIAYFMGYTELCLLGMDLDYTAGRHYFFEADEWLLKVNAPTLRDKTYIGLINLARTLANKGVKVRNLSRGFKPENYAQYGKQRDLIETGVKLEDVISGIVNRRNIGLVCGSFYPLDAYHIKLIKEARVACDLLILGVEESQNQPVVESIRGVSKSIQCKSVAGCVAQIQKQYPNDRIRIVYDESKPIEYETTDKKISLYPVFRQEALEEALDG